MSPEPAFSGLDPDKVLDLAQRCIGAATLVRDSARTVNADLARVRPTEPAPYLTALNDFATWLEESATDLTIRANAIAAIQAVDRLPLISLDNVVPLPAHRFPSKAAADAKVEELLGKKGSKPDDYIDDPGKLEKLSREVAKYASDPDFAAVFVRRFGAENLVEVPRTLQFWEFQRAMTGSTSGAYHEHYRQNKKWMKEDPENVKGILYSFSAVLATATHSADASARDTVKNVARDDDLVALSWLMSPDGLVFSTDFLLEAFQNGVVDRIVDQNLNASNRYYKESYALGGLNGRGLELDPMVPILDALSRNSEAARAAVQMDFGRKPLKVHRPGEESVVVRTAIDLLMDHGSYDDKGAALGAVLAAANDELHAADKAEEANMLLLRMVHALTPPHPEDEHPSHGLPRGRPEVADALRGMAAILAKHHVDDLHQAALGSDKSAGFGRTDGVVGTAGPDRIILSDPQMTMLFAALSRDFQAHEIFLKAVTAHQIGLVQKGMVTHPPNPAWAIELAQFNGLLANSVGFAEKTKYDEAVARNQRVVAVIDTVVSFLPGGRMMDVLKSPVIDVPGAVKEAFAPGASWDRSVGDINRLRSQAGLATRALVVKTLYESGQLGTPSELVPAMEAIAMDIHGGAGGKVPRFFHAAPPQGDGHLISYGELDGMERNAFNHWIETEVHKFPAAREILGVVDDAWESKIEDLDT
ncbi:MAG: hypothetical protein ACRDZ7_04520 [Acidimicrobiia bacterium]